MGAEAEVRQRELAGVQPLARKEEVGMAKDRTEGKAGDEPPDEGAAEIEARINERPWLGHRRPAPPKYAMSSDRMAIIHRRRRRGK